MQRFKLPMNKTKEENQKFTEFATQQIYNSKLFNFLPRSADFLVISGHFWSAFWRVQCGLDN